MTIFARRAARAHGASLVLCAVLLQTGCGQSNAPTAATNPEAPPDAPAQPAQAQRNAQAVIDVCAHYPIAPIEAALGRIEETKSLNVTDPAAPMRTAGGTGGCFWTAPRLGPSVRIEVQTTDAVREIGFSDPKAYVDAGWGLGPDAFAVDGLGDVARMRPPAGKSLELIAAGNGRVIHLLGDQISQAQAIDIVRAGLDAPMRP